MRGVQMGVYLYLYEHMTLPCCCWQGVCIACVCVSSFINDTTQHAWTTNVHIHMYVCMSMCVCVAKRVCYLYVFLIESPSTRQQASLASLAPSIYHDHKKENNIANNSRSIWCVIWKTTRNTHTPTTTLCIYVYTSPYVYMCYIERCVRPYIHSS